MTTVIWLTVSRLFGSTTCCALGCTGGSCGCGCGCCGRNAGEASLLFIVISDVLELSTAPVALPELLLLDATDCTEIMDEAVGDGGCGLASIASWPMLTSMAVVGSDSVFLGDAFSASTAGGGVLPLAMVTAAAAAAAAATADGGGGALPFSFLTKCC